MKGIFLSNFPAARSFVDEISSQPIGVEFHPHNVFHRGEIKMVQTLLVVDSGMVAEEFTDGDSSKYSSPARLDQMKSSIWKISTTFKSCRMEKRSNSTQPKPLSV